MRLGGISVRPMRALTRITPLLLAAKGARSKMNVLRCVNGWAHARFGHYREPQTVGLEFADVTLWVDTSRAEFIPFMEIWNEHTYDAIPEFSACGLDCVVDVGANIGLYSLYQAIRKKAKRVISFEPAPSVFPRLMANLRTNLITNVDALNSAVGGHIGEVEFLETQLSFNCHIASDEQKGISIPCVTLDSALSGVPRVNLLKIDVEGYELQVLAGASNMLSRTDRIVIEIAAPSTLNDSKRILHMHGLRFTGARDSIQYFSRES